MLKLTLLRHAKSSWDYPMLNDYLRPLSARGYRQATRVAENFPDDVDVIWCSPAVRAYITVSCLVHDHPYLNHFLHFKESLYEANANELFQLLQTVRDKKHIALVGHNPGLEILAGNLLGCEIRLKTSHLAQLTIKCDEWSSLTPHCATLDSLWRPNGVIK